MKRTILPLLVAVALVAGLDTAVAADPPSAPGAQASAKKKAGKCPAKPKKGKKKAGKAVADSAAKKKGKKKAAKCQAKPKKKAKAKPKAGAFKLADGVYRDSKSSVQLTVAGGGTTATLRAELSCFLYTSQSVPLTISGNTAKASGDHGLFVIGEPTHVKWSLTVQSTLDYKLEIGWDLGNGVCKSQKIVNGKFAKAVGVSTATAAADGGAQATAKKKAGKKKAAKCPAKPKGKKKAGKAVADSAAKKKGKKKAAKCKAKPKKKAKTTPKAGAFKLADGNYKHGSVSMSVTDGGTKATVYFPLSCFAHGSDEVPLTSSGNTATASETYTQPIAGLASTISWSLTVQSTLDYKLQANWKIGDSGRCESQKTFSGKLVKVG